VEVWVGPYRVTASWLPRQLYSLQALHGLSTSSEGALKVVEAGGHRMATWSLDSIDNPHVQVRHHACARRKTCPASDPPPPRSSLLLCAVVYRWRRCG
jgi:hypothetical protein